MSSADNIYDFLIAGSGFAGSIMALCLTSKGFSVCLVEKESHPKFAIGESSTPIADMILRDLAETYDLSQLKKLSRYGSWQKHYPKVTCGIKRGFSYYKHNEGERFTSDPEHSKELLVAASVDDQNSDTQWYRPDVDHLFVQMVIDAGINYIDQTEINSARKKASGVWALEANRHGESIQFDAGFIIDATGSSGFSKKFLGTTSSTQHFHTHTRAVYSHFEDVPEWNSFLDKRGFKTDDYPYNPDHSALHHLLKPGWLWMLRFNSGVLSAGLVLDGQNADGLSPDQEWQKIIGGYPSIEKLFSGSKVADRPGKIIGTGRLQRRLNRIAGSGWAALHHTGGFVDPLHSTGIAHSLAGVEKLLTIFVNTQSDHAAQINQLQSYEDAFFDELELIDLLVSGCYKSRHHFDLFTAWTMLYFICSVHYEQARLNGNTPDHFLSAGHTELSEIVSRSHQGLQNLLTGTHTQANRDKYIESIRKQIEPFNNIGLMDPQKRNMYTHTAVRL